MFFKKFKKPYIKEPENFLSELDYQEQLKNGFRNLVFFSKIEEEFLDYFRKFTVNHIQFGLSAGFFLVLLAIMTSHYIYALPSNVALSFYLALVVGYLLPMFLLLAFYYFNNKKPPAYQFNVAALGLVLTLVPFFRWSFESRNLYYPFQTESYIIIYIFLLSGLKFRTTILLTVYSWATIFIYDYVMGHSFKDFIERMYNVLAVSTLAMAGGYSQEYIARSNFIYSAIYRYRAVHDSLTRLYNRRGFEDRLMIGWRMAIADKKVLGLILVDVDFFRKFNETYGHITGDQALSRVADALRVMAARGPLDAAGHLGSENFILLIYENNVAAIRQRVQEIDHHIANLNILNKNVETGYLGVSMAGLTFSPDQEVDDLTLTQKLSALLIQLDKLLYQTKQQGGDRVMQL